MSALGSVDQLKSIAIEERPVWRLHWSAFSNQRECVWQLTRFGGRKWRPGLNRISHPDWVKLSVELNSHTKLKYEIFPFSTMHIIYIYIYIYIYTCINIYIFMHVHTHTHTYIYKHVETHTHTHIYIYIYIYIYIF